jgi:HTH-type transcriptional regulator / antitoxin HigA
MTKQGQTFCPDWISPPGDTIVDLMEERDWSQAELSQRLGFSTKHLNQLIKGKVSLSNEAALRLERVLGSTANFWLNREAKYREHLARLQAQERYASWIGWLDQLPLADLKKAQVIPNEKITKSNKPVLVERLLSFFGIASPEEWQTHYGGMQASFRRTRESQSDVGAIVSWLRLGEIEAEKMDTPKYNKPKFEKALKGIRELTTLKPEKFEPELRRLCYEAGVKLVFVPAVKCAHVSGVARWLNGHSPLIQLSLYGKYNDRFWFTFFHEAAHILLHAGKKSDIFLDDPNNNNQDSPEEQEANTWAGEMLIPSAYPQELQSLKSAAEIKAFASALNIHPGIVVGRMQHEDLLKFATPLNGLKDKFQLLNP